MALRIVSKGGARGFDTQIFNAETGEDVTASMHVTHIDITIDVNNIPQATITTIMPPLDITIEDAQIRRVCPCCGRGVEKE